MMCAYKMVSKFEYGKKQTKTWKKFITNYLQRLKYQNLKREREREREREKRKKI